MKRKSLILIFIFGILLGGYFLYDYKLEEPKKEYYKTLSPKDLNPKSFIALFVKRYNQNPINSITMNGDFPENWVKQKDLNYLMSIINSKQKCCNYMNIFSSAISNEDAEVGGFAIIFLNSYMTKKKINLGLNCSPKVNNDSIMKIKKWYKDLN